MATIRNPINPNGFIDLNPALEQINPQFGQYSNSGLFAEQGVLLPAHMYKVIDQGTTKMTKLTSRTERDAMAVDKKKQKIVTMAGITIKEVGGVHVEDLIGLTNGFFDAENPTFQEAMVKELESLANVGAANYEYLITTATQGRVLDPLDGSVAIDQYANTGTTRTTFTLDASPTSDIFAEINRLSNTLTTLNGYNGNIQMIEVVVGEQAFRDITSHPDLAALYQLAYTGMGQQTINQPYLNGTTGQPQRNSYGFRREFVWQNVMFVTYPQEFQRWNGTAANIVSTNKGWTIVKGVAGLYEVKYAPAPYISTMNQAGQRWTARSSGIVDDTHADVTLESHLIPFMKRPEMSLDITVTK